MVCDARDQLLIVALTLRFGSSAGRDMARWATLV